MQLPTLESGGGSGRIRGACVRKGMVGPQLLSGLLTVSFLIQ